jgi:hypothetical protein
MAAHPCSECRAAAGDEMMVECASGSLDSLPITKLEHSSMMDSDERSSGVVDQSDPGHVGRRSGEDVLIDVVDRSTLLHVMEREEKMMCCSLLESGDDGVVQRSVS